ncbi:hypothetical protein MMC25_002307 [Agyrium rufum]|nr:hypothetical protein [Agyrium rufum]
MLEQQQSQLVNGLQELYSLVVAGQTWPGPLLDESTNGRPLTHDILSNLGVLHNDSSNSSEIFEEDLELLQARLERDGVSTSSPKHHSSDSDEETYSNCRLEPPTKRTFQQSTRPSATRQSLSNPSVHSPQAQSGKWQSKFGAASSTSRNNQQSTRPHSIHTYPPFGANQGSIDPSSINPMAMWLDSPLSYDETLDFGSLGDVPSLADARFGTKTQTIAPSMMNANHSTSNFITNWTEDEFTKFMNSSTRT